MTFDEHGWRKVDALKDEREKKAWEIFLVLRKNYTAEYAAAEAFQDADAFIAQAKDEWGEE